MEADGVKMKACARCRDQRTRCPPDCKYAPYFPANEPKKYTDVHKVFGASNAVNMLQKLPVAQQEVALKCMVYEAEARLQYPVYGCSEVIRALREKVQALESQNSSLKKEVHRLQQMTLLVDMLAAKVHTLQRPGTAFIGNVGKVQILQSQLNYHNDNVVPLEVMSEAAPSYRNPSQASLSNSGLPC